jgi:hypothetical protein
MGAADGAVNSYFPDQVEQDLIFHEEKRLIPFREGRIFVKVGFGWIWML